jgi:stage III sporulation protein AD
MEISTIVVIGIIGAVICVVINQYKPEYTVLVALATGLIVLLFASEHLSSILEYVNRFISLGDIDSNYGEIVVKALGVCVVTQLASDTCKDCGQGSIASKIELGGKVSILALSIPLFVSLLETVQRLINL